MKTNSGKTEAHRSDGNNTNNEAPGKAGAASNGNQLVQDVAGIAKNLGLETLEGEKDGHRLWGAARKIDLVLKHASNDKKLGLECVYQGVPGSAERKIFATLSDIDHWSMPGLVVLGGQGFTAGMKRYLLSTGKAVELADLESKLLSFFGLPGEGEPARN